MTARPDPYQNTPDEPDPGAAFAAGMALLTDDELRAMTRRAWIAAARNWQDLRAWTPAAAMTTDDYRHMRAMLAEDAHASDDWHALLRAEAERRRQDAAR